MHASGTVDLHRVPLILTISVGLYTQLAAYEIPHSIGAFYDEMVRELLRRHDFRAEGQLRMNKYKAEDKHRFLRELALHLAETRPSSFADFTYGDLIDFCAARRGAMPRLRDERDFVDEIIDRSGLLSRTTDDGHFAFAHRALHEHLAAAQLARDPGPGCRFLIGRTTDPQWRQVTVLFCGEAHPYVPIFLGQLADRSPELACHCLATAEVSADLAHGLINRARRHSMLSAIMEAVKSPVADTRTFALDALRTELVWIARHADRQERRRIVAELFGGHSPVAGKLLLAMSRHATPAMAAAIIQLTATMPDDEPALVAPLWHCLAIPDVARRWEVAREIVTRLLVLAMDPECAAVLDRLPALQPDWPSAEDRAAAYPLKRGLPPESNLVTLLGLGHALRTFDGLPRKNLYLVALTDPAAPLALMEASASWSKLSLYRMAKIVSYTAFYAALAGNVLAARFYLGDVDLHPRAALTALAVSMVACTAVMLALSAVAVRRFWDHVHAAPFTAWCYLVPAVDPNFGLSRVEPLWRLLVKRPGMAKPGTWRDWLDQVAPEAAAHLFLTGLYGLPIALALWSWPWLVPIVVVPVLLVFYWLPATELCGRHTTRVFLPSRRFLDIYQDPASRHWVLPGSDRGRPLWPDRQQSP